MIVHSQSILNSRFILDLSLILLELNSPLLTVSLFHLFALRVSGLLTSPTISFSKEENSGCNNPLHLRHNGLYSPEAHRMKKINTQDSFSLLHRIEL